MPIFVDTDKKLFNGSKAGNSKAKAEEKMQKAVKKIIDKADGFTTTKSGKGYALSLTVAKVEVIGLKTKCSLSAALSRYPKAANGELEHHRQRCRRGCFGRRGPGLHRGPRRRRGDKEPPDHEERRRVEPVGRSSILQTPDNRSSSPVLSPNLSRFTPNLSIRLSDRFANGVPFGYFR